MLVELDQSDAKIGLAEAEAAVAQALARVSQTVTTGTALIAAVDASNADIRRRQAPVGVANANLAQARTARGSVQGQLSANDALIGCTLPSAHPDVMAATARLERARQLDQGGAALASAHRARSSGAQGPPFARGPCDDRAIDTAMIDTAMIDNGANGNGCSAGSRSGAGVPQGLAPVAGWPQPCARQF